jgi:DNA-binding MltR family transcriptional regulator
MGKRNRGQNRRAIPKPPKPTLMSIMVATLHESDRGLVMVLSQLIQDYLEKLLRSFFRYVYHAPEDSIDFLLSHDVYDPPLGNSSPRLAMCRVLGLIDDSLQDAIRALQKIRNYYFAHYTGEASLTDTHVRRMLLEFKKHSPKKANGQTFEWYKKEHLIYERKVGFVPNHKFDSDERIDFLTCAHMVAMALLETQSAIFTQCLSQKQNEMIERK